MLIYYTGLAEPIRMIFAVAGQKYEDVRIPREEWAQHKESMWLKQIWTLICTRFGTLFNSILNI